MLRELTTWKSLVNLVGAEGGGLSSGWERGHGDWSMDYTFRSSVRRKQKKAGRLERVAGDGLLNGKSQPVGREIQKGVRGHSPHQCLPSPLQQGRESARLQSLRLSSGSQSGSNPARVW
jgi:hypothetical protein